MSLTTILGPMFAGKTSYLLDLLTRYADLHMKVLYINSSKDVRDTESKDNCVTTHSSQFIRLSVKIDAVKCMTLVDIDSTIQSAAGGGYDVIGIDECQFFGNLVEPVKRWVFQYNKIVICAGLDGNFLMQPMGQVLSLIPMSCDVIKLKAKCKHCMKPGDPFSLVDAAYTAKLKKSDTIEEAGGEELYVPLCLKHYREFTPI